MRLAITVSFLMIAHCTPGGDSGGGGSGSGGKAGGSGAGGASAGGGGAGVSGSGGSGGGGAIATGGTGGGTGGTGGSGGAGPSTGGQSGGGQGGSGSGSGGSGGGAADAPGGETPAASGPGCAGVTAKFCDDWDKLAAGQAPTGEFTISASGGGTVLVDTAQKFSGANSLHFKSAGGGKVMLLFTKQFPINDQHGRLMLYMPKKPTTGSHWDIIQSHSPTNHWELGGQNGGFELVVDPPDDGIDSATPFPEGNQWYCIQWNFKNPGDTFVAKLDGVLVKPSPVVGRWKSGTWRDLTVGWEIFGSSAADFWVDDLAFGEQEIPCPSK